MDDIPLIDISPLCQGHEGKSVISEIESALRYVGFMYVRGHAINSLLINVVQRSVRQYFEKPEPEKLEDKITPDNYRGYIPKAFFSPASGDMGADNYEGYKLHFEVAADDPICAACDLYGPNKWPDYPSGLRLGISAYWNECDRLSEILLRAISTILAIDANELVGLFEKPLTNMTLLHYPPQPDDPSGFGIHPHKDTDVITILASEPVGGLRVRRRNDDGWITANPPEDAMIVNIGDLLELWSGGYLVSTPHKVVGSASTDRYSFPYFVVPRHDVVVEPLRTVQPGFDRPPVHVGDVSRAVWRGNWPDVVHKGSAYDLGTLSD